MTLAGLTIKNVSFDLFSRTGTIRVSSEATLTLSACSVANTGGRSGSGIVVNGATLIAENSTFEQNSAVLAGGAVALYNSTATFTNCDFLENASLFEGAAVYVGNGSSANFFGGNIAGNASWWSDGHAVYVEQGSTANLTDVKFNSNSPLDLGGNGTINTTDTATSAILDVDVELLDFAILELEDEITLF